MSHSGIRPLCLDLLMNFSSKFAVMHEELIQSPLKGMGTPYSIQCLAFCSSVKNFESCSQRKNLFIVLLRTLYFFLFHLYMELHVEGIELPHLSARVPQLQWGTYGHHQVTRAYRLKQTSVLCLFRTQWVVGHFLLFARSIFSLMFIPIKMLNHQDGVMQNPPFWSFSSDFTFSIQGSVLRHDKFLLSLWLYFAD